MSERAVRWRWNVAAAGAVIAVVVVAVAAGWDVGAWLEATSAATAGAYSIGQQLLTTVWNIVLAAVLVAAAFGRSGGKVLVEQSAARARELQPEHADAAGGHGAAQPQERWCGRQSCSNERNSDG